MKQMAILTLGFCVSLVAMAQSSTEHKIKITGDAAEQIASFTVDTGSTGNSVFSTGTVSAHCVRPIPLEGTGVAASHYTCVLSPAQATTNPVKNQVSSESLEILDAVSHCPEALAGLSSAGRIGSATVQSTTDLSLYTVSFVAGGYAPTFKTKVVGKLIIAKSFQRSSVQVPDAPGGQMVYSCDVSKE